MKSAYVRTFIIFVWCMTVLAEFRFRSWGITKGVVETERNGSIVNNRWYWYICICLSNTKCKCPWWERKDTWL